MTKQSSNTLIAETLSIFVTLVLVGCAPVMETRRPTPVDVKNFHIGEARIDVIVELGAPITTVVNGSSTCDVYKLYTRGLHGGGKFAVAADEEAPGVFTLGLSEVLFTPIEAGTRNSKHTVLFCYGPDNEIAMVRVLQAIDDSSVVANSAPVVVNSTPPLGPAPVTSKDSPPTVTGLHDSAPPNSAPVVVNSTPPLGPAPVTSKDSPPTVTGLHDSAPPNSAPVVVNSTPPLGPAPVTSKDSPPTVTGLHDSAPPNSAPVVVNSTPSLGPVPVTSKDSPPTVTGLHDSAPPAAPQANSTSRDAHVRLGVHCTQLTPALAHTGHFPVDTGVRVATVEAGSVAEANGIKVGDVLLKYGDRSLNEISDLMTAIAATTQGADVPITVWRRTGESVVDVQF